MMIQTLEKPVVKTHSFNLNVTKKEISNHGVVNFNSKKEINNENPFWDGRKLTIPVHGVYKITWGFYQRSLVTFYKDLETKLALIINNKAYLEKAIITKETPCFHAVKSSQVTTSLLLRENETLSLYPEILNAELPNMKDVFLKVEKMLN